MDPFSDEIIGIKVQIAGLFEKCQEYQKAIDVLEIVKSDNLKWMDLLSQKGNEGKRTRVLTWCVKVSVKLGDLYACPYILETEKAEESLVWAVETVMGEKKRREVEGVKEGEGEWLSDEEEGGSLEGIFTSFSQSIGNTLTRYSACTPLRRERSPLSRSTPFPPSNNTLETNQLPHNSSNEQSLHLPRPTTPSYLRKIDRYTCTTRL